MIETRILKKGDEFKVQYRHKSFFNRIFLGWIDFKDLGWVKKSHYDRYPAKIFHALSDARVAERKLIEAHKIENSQWRPVHKGERAR